MEAGVATVAVSGMEVLMEMTVDLYVTSVIYIHVGICNNDATSSAFNSLLIFRNT